MKEYERGFHNGQEKVLSEHYNHAPNYIMRDMGIEKFNGSFTFHVNNNTDREVFWEFVEEQLKQIKKASEVKHWIFNFAMEERRMSMGIGDYRITISILWDNKNKALDKAIQNLLLRIESIAPYEAVEQPNQ